MVSGSTILAIIAWSFKMMLLLVGLVMLVSPGYALYLRAIGLFLLAVAILTFRTVQGSLLAERGIRIPNVVVAVLLIGSIMVGVAVIPGAGDLEPSNERLETTDGTLVFSVDVTNTADGPITGEDFVIAVNASGETIAETRREDEEFGRDETRTVTAELVSVAALSESERMRIENDGFEIMVTIDPDSTEVTWRYSASELRIKPVDDLLDGTDSEADGANTDDGTDSASDIPSEAFEPPVNSTALGQGHSDTLKEVGSFTFEEDFSVESTDADRLIRDETITATFDLNNNQSLTEISTVDLTRTAYGTGTEKYERIDDSSGDPQYVIPDRDIGPEPYLESEILAELETIDVEHQKTDAGHVYSASGVDAVSEGFFEADVDSFQSFEFEAVVSEQGVLKEFSYQIEIEDGGEVITVTRSGELKEIGTTEVREPTWLDDARQATS